MASGRTPFATEIHDTPQKSGRVPEGNPYLIVIHHAATLDFDAVVELEMGGRQVSSTVIVKDDRAASMFDEAYRAWSLSSQFYDSVSLSSETCNSGGAESGWPISEGSYHTLARIVAQWASKYGIPLDREHVIGHREVYERFGASYATACPGGIDLDRLVSMALDYQNGTLGGTMSATVVISDAVNQPGKGAWFLFSPGRALWLKSGKTALTVESSEGVKRQTVNYDWAGDPNKSFKDYVLAYLGPSVKPEDVIALIDKEGAAQELIAPWARPGAGGSGGTSFTKEELAAAVDQVIDDEAILAALTTLLARPVPPTKDEIRLALGQSIVNG